MPVDLTSSMQNMRISVVAPQRRTTKIETNGVLSDSRSHIKNTELDVRCVDNKSTDSDGFAVNSHKSSSSQKQLLQLKAPPTTQTLKLKNKKSPPVYSEHLPLRERPADIPKVHLNLKPAPSPSVQKTVLSLRSPSNNQNVHFSFDRRAIDSMTAVAPLSTRETFEVPSPTLSSPLPIPASFPITPSYQTLAQKCSYCYFALLKMGFSEEQLVKESTLIDLWLGHTARDASGAVSCPIMQHIVCEICGATGRRAHDQSHCPTLPNDLDTFLRMHYAANNSTN